MSLSTPPPPPAIYIHSICVLQMRPYIGAHLHPDSPSSHQNRNVFRFSSDASRWALQVLVQIFCSQLQVSLTHGIIQVVYFL